MKKSRPRPAATLALAMALTSALSVAPPALARPELCESAAVRAARDAGVPAEVMLAITLTETGRTLDERLRPWPWTANAEGQGHWFATPDEAARFARSLLARGQDLFDLGCFQINWHWHGDQFARPEDLLDPMIAGRYAARLIADLHDEFGSWEGAAGAYHSRTPRYADRYRARFTRIRAGLRDAPALTALLDNARPGTIRVNTFPLLGGQASGASLVPDTASGTRPFIEVRP
ncbi:lytic transglycosylase domain-containing protein [Rhodobacter sp. NTK016B]|uniref:lytic transglycosylase domain-containing protein n=1 Tax=Rhodobacter sp. NTK016B TaxID=2759676 RepID=UPI002570560F|nr:lytic transglycosylase domain-containing protein [Rhodobacter sp. NTK016B]